MNPPDILLAGLALAVVLAIGLLVLNRQRGPGHAIDPNLDATLRALSAAQSEIAGRLAQTIDGQAHSQAEMQRILAQRLDAMDQRMGINLKENSETLGGLRERLTVIDEAQKNLAEISGQVVSLQQIFANKQTRGAFGQAQMESIVRDALPTSLYDFQATLSNNSRPDCLIRLPNKSPAIVIDSKFPLECFDLLRAATSDAERKAATVRVKNDVGKHVKDIADKYLIVGETQDPAIMFVPSEAIYAELHDSFSELIQQAHRTRVVVVSPNILMLAINTVQTVLKDARMREQATLIQREVGSMIRDVQLLDERVQKLQRHFGQADGDLKDILTSIERIVRRGERIEQVDVGTVADAAAQEKIRLVGKSALSGI